MKFPSVTWRKCSVDEVEEQVPLILEEFTRLNLTLYDGYVTYIGKRKCNIFDTSNSDAVNIEAIKHVMAQQYYGPWESTQRIVSLRLHGEQILGPPKWKYICKRDLTLCFLCMGFTVSWKDGCAMVNACWYKTRCQDDSCGPCRKRAAQSRQPDAYIRSIVRVKQNEIETDTTLSKTKRNKKIMTLNKWRMVQQKAISNWKQYQYEHYDPSIDWEPLTEVPE